MSSTTEGSSPGPAWRMVTAMGSRSCSLMAVGRCPSPSPVGSESLSRFPAGPPFKRPRRAGPGDEPSVVELIQELAVAVDYPSTIDEHYVRHFLASPVSDALLAIDAGTPVGLLSYAVVPGLFHAADSGLIEALVVAEDRRSEGIGRQLLTAAIKLLEEKKCSEISIGAGADDEAVQKLYFEAGLTEASVLLEKHVDK